MARYAAVGVAGTPVREDRLHVTLAILDDYPALPPVVTDAMRTAADGVDVPAFEICFDRLIGGGGILPVQRRRSAGLAELGRALHAAMARVGLPLRRNWRFSPHVTLRYDAGQRFSRAVDPIRWRVEDFRLVHSHVGLTRHDVLGTWRLTEEALLF